MRQTITATAVLAMLSLPSAGIAQGPQTANALSLTLRTAGDRREFRPGETIPIELEFNSPVPGRFFVRSSTYDYSGRLTIDEYRIEPNDLVTDPMLDYFAASRGFVGGGASTNLPIDKPVIVRLALNEWFRFERPGTYTVSLRSSRVTDGDPRGPGRPAVVPVESNTISFAVLPPDPQWEASEVRLASQILSSRAWDPFRRDGCRILRFLATDAAVDEMIKRYDDGQWGCEFDHMIGMFAAADRARTVRQMEAGLRTNRPPVSENYLETLAILSVYLQHPEFAPAQTRVAKGNEPRSGELSRHEDLIQAAQAKYAAIVTAADPAPTFLELSPERQLRLLRDEWPRVNTPTMTTVLRQLEEGTSSSWPSIADVALRRLYEVAPEQARPIILGDIQSPPQDATLATLGLLPERELPWLDEVLLSNVQSAGVDGADSIHSELLQRYASAQIAQRLLVYVDSRIGRMACRQQAALLAYFLRTDESRGQTLLDRALTSRSTGCSQTVLADVARYKK
ncbi:MAG TPA: hypothetical protein VGZ27_11660 [Vicinamibacterales bacterium]|nr:hypothetical protein [Vicinamibacterales bacterium]